MSGAIAQVLANIMGISATRLILNVTGASLGRALSEAPTTLHVTCVILNVDPAAPAAPAVPSGAVRRAGGGSALALLLVRSCMCVCVCVGVTDDCRGILGACGGGLAAHCWRWYPTSGNRVLAGSSNLATELHTCVVH